MVLTTTVVLKGHVIIEGVKFLWWVTDGKESHLTVSHPLHGTRTQRASQQPEAQARELARALLAERRARRS